MKAEIRTLYHTDMYIHTYTVIHIPSDITPFRPMFPKLLSGPALIMCGVRAALCYASLGDTFEEYKQWHCNDYKEVDGHRGGSNLLLPVPFLGNGHAMGHWWVTQWSGGHRRTTHMVTG